MELGYKELDEAEILGIIRKLDTDGWMKLGYHKLRAERINSWM
jgi:hypothetical protein